MAHDVSVDFDDGDSGRFAEGPFRALIEAVLTAEGVHDAGVGLRFSDDELLRRLNREHRDVDEPTDVLSFAGEERELIPAPEGGPRYLGDIAVSVETAQRQAEEAGLTVDEELRHLVLHGLLHLLGHDHATAEEAATMRAREEAVLGPQIHRGSGHEDGG